MKSLSSSFSTNVPVNTAITATFSEAVTGVDKSSFTVNGVTGTVSYDSGTNTATFKPSSALAYQTKYTATLSSAIKDAAGNALTQKSWSFTTQSKPVTTDTTAPNVVVTNAVDKTSHQITDGGTTTSKYIKIMFKATDAGGIAKNRVQYRWKSV